MIGQKKPDRNLAFFQILKKAQFITMNTKLQLPVFFLLLLIHIFSVHRTLATVPVSTAIQSADTTVTLVMHFEDASNISTIRTEAERIVPGIALIFQALQKDGILHEDYSRLIIVERKHYTEGSRFEHYPSIITFSPKGSLICNNPDVQQFEPILLGPAYIIQTSTGLLNWADLLAMIIKMQELSSDIQSLNITDEAILQSIKETELYVNILNKEFVWEETLGAAETFSIKNRIYRTQLQSQIIDKEQNIIAQMPERFRPIATPAFHILRNSGGTKTYLGWSSAQEASLIHLETGRISQIELPMPAGGQVHDVQFYYSESLASIVVLVREALGQIASMWAYNVQKEEWSRMFQQVPRHVLSDSIFVWQMEEKIKRFVPIRGVTVMRNADIIFEEPLAGQGPGSSPFQLPVSAIVVLALVFVFILILRIWRRIAHQKNSPDSK